MESRERFYEIYEDVASKKWKGIQDKDTKAIIVEASKYNGFTSLLPSRRNAQMGLPAVATFNRYSSNGCTIERGILDILTNKIIFVSGEYDFIDGFDGGLARFYKILDNKKRWGIIGLLKDNKGHIETKELIKPEYDNLWNFYDKGRSNIPAEKNGNTEDISLTALRDSLISSESSVKAETQDINNNDEFNRQYDMMFNQSDELITIGEVSVSNFKRFISPTSVELSSRITFIVGKNNAGKSTFLNLVEMMTNNMYDLHLIEAGIPYFCFDENNKELERQNELLKKYRNRFLESAEPIIISLISGKWKFEYVMNDSALIDKIIITSTENKTKIRYHNQYVEVDFVNLPHLKYATSGLNSNSEKRGLDLLLSTIWENVDRNNPYRFSVEQLSDYFITIASIDGAITTSKGVERIGVFAPVAQKEIKQGNDFVNESILKYYEIDKCADKTNVYHQFVCKWMKRMEMGCDFVITEHNEGNKQTYTSIEIVNDKGIKTDLCDMGSGTIHFFSICFKLLTLIEKYKGNHYTPIILIEEPEQNLHPMLQSHIANFLLDVSDMFAETFAENDPMHKIGMKMVVETHSEYIIRRSQVLAKRFLSSNEENPFRVYYFPTDGKPWDMIYRDNGRFENKFGEGFLDESSYLAYQLL